MSSKIFNFNTFLGKLIRFPLRLLPTNAIFPILQGKLKCKKWIVGSGIHGCWLGTYEYKKRKLFEKYIKKGFVIYDIGAHVGYYALLSSVLTGKTGKVYAFEPLPKNLYFLRKHLELNEITNVEIFENAVSSFSGISNFSEHTSSFQGYLSQEGNLKVKTISLDDFFIKQNLLPPDMIKMDIEGGELNALMGMKDLLIKFHPVIFLATHSNDLHIKCIDFFKSLEYKILPIDKNKNLLETDEIIAFKISG